MNAIAIWAISGHSDVASKTPTCKRVQKEVIASIKENTLSSGGSKWARTAANDQAPSDNRTVVLGRKISDERIQNFSRGPKSGRARLETNARRCRSLQLPERREKVIVLIGLYPRNCQGSQFDTLLPAFKIFCDRMAGRHARAENLRGQ